jgi:hypothetical protein
VTNTPTIRSLPAVIYAEQPFFIGAAKLRQNTVDRKNASGFPVGGDFRWNKRGMCQRLARWISLVLRWMHRKELFVPAAAIATWYSYLAKRPDDLVKTP